MIQFFLSVFYSYTREVSLYRHAKCACIIGSLIDKKRLRSTLLLCVTCTLIACKINFIFCFEKKKVRLVLITVLFCGMVAS